jgi:branched-chain amino acid aminotransferase
MYKNAKYFIFDNQVLKTEEFEIKELEKGFSIYEVVKITRGIPLFFEEHINRLQHSAEIKNKIIPYTNSEIENSIYKLIKLNNLTEGRLKFAVRYHHTGNKLILFFLNPITPSKENYSEGINIKLFKTERPEPNVKIINYTLRTTVNTLVRENNIFEVLFFNKDGFISECSKSNIFFVKNNIIYTSFEKDVLAGITRKYIYQICKNNSIEIREGKIGINELENFDSAFITGTSLGVLQVKKIDHIFYKVPCKLINRLSNSYKQIAENYISVKTGI